MQNTRLKEILDASGRLFINQGYSKTQVSHIAKAIGVSVGTIYHDFIGKNEIRDFVLKCTICPDYIGRDLERPITSDAFSNLEADIMNTFKNHSTDFAAHLNTPNDGYTFEELISDTFDMLSKYAVAFLFIEKNPQDCGKLVDIYKSYRHDFFNIMNQYINMFINKKIIRPLENPQLSTMLMIETLSWWSMDVRYSTFESNNISLEDAKKVCLDNIINAYRL